MTTTNSSATETLSVVQIREDYARSGLAPRGGIGNGTFFAKRNDRYWLLIVPESDPRSSGMWNGADVALSVGLDNPETYRAWNVEARFVESVEEFPTVEESPVDSPREVSTATDLRPGDVFRIGVTDTAYVVTGESRDGGRTLPIEWAPGGRNNSLADWRGPSTPSVSVTLVPESEQTEWARNKSREVSPTVTESPEESPVESSPEETVTLTAAELAERLESAKREGKREADVQFEEWKESANATAIEYANDNSLCSEFDRCMRDIGMMDRDEWREHNAQEFTVEFTYSTTVMAYDSDEAIERASEEFEGEQWRGEWSVV